MRYGPPFRYADREDGRRVAYQVVGDGDLDLVFLFGWPTHLGLMWENPSCASFLRGLSSFSRLLLYDRVGGGLSDRGQTGCVFEDEMDDVRAVMAATGSRRAALFGCHTVKDLVAGAGYAFADRGTLTLKGVPDSWQLYAVELADP